MRMSEDATSGGRTIREIGPALKQAIEAYVADKGKIYAPIAHPGLAHVPTHWNDDRFELIEPHLDHRGGTALDVGSHWGYFASRLEDIGYRVTANEYSRKHRYFLEAIRDASGRTFAIMPENILEAGPLDFDIIMALNIFHHFLKSRQAFDAFQGMLARTRCRTMIYQAHSLTERAKLDVAGLFLEPEAMVALLSERLKLPEVTLIAVARGRRIYKLAG